MKTRPGDFPERRRHPFIRRVVDGSFRQVSWLYFDVTAFLSSSSKRGFTVAVTARDFHPLPYSPAGQRAPESDDKDHLYDRRGNPNTRFSPSQSINSFQVAVVTELSGYNWKLKTEN
jgi:hypothetical protein